MLIDIENENILNAGELIEEALSELRKNSGSGFIIIARNHFSKGVYAHINTYSKVRFTELVKSASICYETIPLNKNFVHEERIYRREDKKLLFRTAAI